jgi:predicted SAM-dependent methyltransferase
MDKKFLNLACGDYFVDSNEWVNIDWAPKSNKVKQANLLIKLPFPNETFDFVYCSHFIEHVSVENLHNFINECNRVLKIDGRIRLVLPDLENIAREYISNIDKNLQIFAEFNVVEMIDQCVRKKSGGELIKWYKISQTNPELMAYVSKRTGYSLSSKINRKNSFVSRVRNLSWKSALIKTQRIYVEILLYMLPKWYKENHISRTATGEQHVWMHDFNSIQKLLSRTGFISIYKLDAQNSKEKNFPIYPLDVDASGISRKGEESMYIEAKKLKYLLTT